ncbi:MAG: M20/M25/M40 family metallo-hydrolase [Anaerolineales bacterium]|nr:M20/M25/M40 family metallo-hydrolase [Anaerolineales bacterium]
MTDHNIIQKQIRTQLDSSLADLRRLCSQPSIAAQGLGMNECAGLVAELLEARGFDTRIMPTRGFPVVFAERSGREDRTLLFYNHYDVQPPEPLDLWDSEPFEPEIRGGKMYARGVSDDKGHIISRLATIDALLSIEGELPCNVKFVIEGEEEIGSLNLPEFVKMNHELLSADACLWEFGGVDHEGVPVQYAGLRGDSYVELSVQTASRDSHSGLGGSIFPNAAWRLVWALNTLKSPDETINLPGFYDRVKHPTERDLALLSDLPDMADSYREIYGVQRFLKDLEGGPELEREAIFSPTCTICGLTSGYQGPGSKTVMPARASAKVDFRLVPDQDADEVVLMLRNHLDENGFHDIEITYLGGENPARTDLDDPFLKLVVETAEPVYGRAQRVVPMSGGSGPNYPFIHDLKLPVATAGLGYPEGNVHAPNENMVIDYFIKAVEHTALILQGFSRMPD